MESKVNAHQLHQLPKIPQNKQKTNYCTCNFTDILKSKLDETNRLKISKHAEKRLKERQICLDGTTWNIIQEKVLEAKQKGIKDSLVVTDNVALVVSAQKNTVITVMNREEARTQIFTNINGTIIL
ncbi:TIGR02530 family flagellar biosynthesis protein [Bacillus sp. FJAT-45350]|uniref:TIGR02530 family flagellar biosynthesis protein n=1 Tax=Bacillus sp. FJAT-45350 TaxID=2011014 RepID=UPI00211BBA4C|nr:TIGR02530 family flagellar biosynthesis protein [Bacillus sp. FJAT-45350]